MLSLTHKDWTLDVLPEIGGAVARLAWRGIEILRPMPRLPTPPQPAPVDAIRRTCAYPLLPWSNRIRNGQLRWRGSTYEIARNYPPDTRASPHPIHGIGWQQPWSVLAHERDHVAMEYEFTARGEAALRWPFAHRGRQEFTLAGDTLTLRLALTSTLSASAPSVGAAAVSTPGGIGWHPFFVAENDAELFCPVRTHWLGDEDILPIRAEAVPPVWYFPQRPQAVTSLVLDSGFAGWSGQAQLRRPSAGVLVTIAATEPLRHLVLYRRADVPWIAIEPVSHMTDAFNRADSGERETGTQVLTPGATLAGQITITCQPRRDADAPPATP